MTTAALIRTPSDDRGFVLCTDPLHTYETGNAVEPGGEMTIAAYEPQ